MRHYDKDLMALLHQQASELGRFISGNRSGHTEDDRFRAGLNAHNFSRTHSLNFAFGISLHQSWPIIVG